MSNMELIDTVPQATANTAVKFENVSKYYTRLHGGMGKNFIKNLFKPEKNLIKALDNISFEIKKGEFAAYAGPNGAGKSTTMKIISAMLYPSSGAIEVLGFDPKKSRIELMRKMGVLFGNRTELWWDHPVKQSFEWKKVVWDIDDKVYEESLAMVTELFDLKEILKTYARELSLGQRMKADIAMMLLHQPELIILDEPTLGLDVSAKRRMINALKTVNSEKNTTIFVTSHDMDDLEEMARRIIMVSGGKLVFDGGFDGLRKLTGDLSRVKISSDLNINGLNIGKVISKEENTAEFEIDLSCISLPELLNKISLMKGIRDIEIKKAPIEQIIDTLYESWKCS